MKRKKEKKKREEKEKERKDKEIPPLFLPRLKNVVFFCVFGLFSALILVVF